MVKRSLELSALPVVVDNKRCFLGISIVEFQVEGSLSPVDWNAPKTVYQESLAIESESDTEILLALAYGDIRGHHAITCMWRIYWEYVLKPAVQKTGNQFLEKNFPEAVSWYRDQDLTFSAIGIPMLVDLKFRACNTLNPGVTQEVDLSNGGLLVTSIYKEPQKSFTLRIAERLDQGLYRGMHLENFLEMYTDYVEDKDNPGWPWNHFATGPELKDKIHGPPTFGIADNLQQIKERCHQYWDSPRSFVLVIRDVEAEPGIKWHKYGPYLGIRDDKKEVISFSFIEIKHAQ